MAELSTYIKRAVLDLHLPEELHGKGYEETLRDALLQELSACIEEEIEKRVGGDERIAIDTLQFDLGSVSAVSSRQEFVERFKKIFPEALDRALQDRSQRRDELELIRAFLETGSYPWWTRQEGANDLGQLIEALAPPAYERLLLHLRSALARPQLSARLRGQLSPERLRRIVADMIGGEGDSLIRAAEAVSAAFAPAGKRSGPAVQAEALERLIKAIGEAKGNLPAPQTLLENLLSEIVIHAGVSKKEIAALRAQLQAEGRTAADPSVKKWLEAIAAEALERALPADELAAARAQANRETVSKAERLLAQLLAYGSLPPGLFEGTIDELIAVLAQKERRSVLLQLHAARQKPKLLLRFYRLLGEAQAEKMFAVFFPAAEKALEKAGAVLARLRELKLLDKEAQEGSGRLLQLTLATLQQLERHFPTEEISPAVLLAPYLALQHAEADRVRRQPAFAALPPGIKLFLDGQLKKQEQKDRAPSAKQEEQRRNSPDTGREEKSFPQEANAKQQQEENPETAELHSLLNAVYLSDLLKHFLLHGRLPWWSERLRARPQLLSPRLRSDSTAEEFFSAALRYFSIRHPDAFRELAAAAGAQAELRFALLWETPAEALELVAAKLLPWRSVSMPVLIRALLELAGKKRNIRLSAAATREALAFFLGRAEKPSEKNTEELLRAFAVKLSSQLELRGGELAALLRDHHSEIKLPRALSAGEAAELSALLDVPAATITASAPQEKTPAPRLRFTPEESLAAFRELLSGRPAALPPLHRAEMESDLLLLLEESASLRRDLLEAVSRSALVTGWLAERFSSSFGKKLFRLLASERSPALVRSAETLLSLFREAPFAAQREQLEKESPYLALRALHGHPGAAPEAFQETLNALIARSLRIPAERWRSRVSAALAFRQVHSTGAEQELAQLRSNFLPGETTVSLLLSRWQRNLQETLRAFFETHEISSEAGALLRGRIASESLRLLQELETRELPDEQPEQVFQHALRRLQDLMEEQSSRAGAKPAAGEELTSRVEESRAKTIPTIEGTDELLQDEAGVLPPETDEPAQHEFESHLIASAVAQADAGEISETAGDQMKSPAASPRSDPHHFLPAEWFVRQWKEAAALLVRAHLQELPAEKAEELRQAGERSQILLEEETAHFSVQLQNTYALRSPLILRAEMRSALQKLAARLEKLIGPAEKEHALQSAAEAETAIRETASSGQQEENVSSREEHAASQESSEEKTGEKKIPGRQKEFPGASKIQAQEASPEIADPKDALYTNPVFFLNSFLYFLSWKRLPWWSPYASIEEFTRYAAISVRRHRALLRQHLLQAFSQAEARAQALLLIEEHLQADDPETELRETQLRFFRALQKLLAQDPNLEKSRSLLQRAEAVLFLLEERFSAAAAQELALAVWREMQALLGPEEMQSVLQRMQTLSDAEMAELFEPAKEKPIVPGKSSAPGKEAKTDPTHSENDRQGRTAQFESAEFSGQEFSEEERTASLLPEERAHLPHEEQKHSTRPEETVHEQTKDQVSSTANDQQKDQSVSTDEQSTAQLNAEATSAREKRAILTNAEKEIFRQFAALGEKISMEKKQEAIAHEQHVVKIAAALSALLPPGKAPALAQLAHSLAPLLPASLLPEEKNFLALQALLTFESLSEGKSLRQTLNPIFRQEEAENSSLYAQLLELRSTQRKIDSSEASAPLRLLAELQGLSRALAPGFTLFGAQPILAQQLAASKENFPSLIALAADAIAAETKNTREEILRQFRTRISAVEENEGAFIVPEHLEEAGRKLQVFTPEGRSIYAARVQELKKRGAEAAGKEEAQLAADALLKILSEPRTLLSEWQKRAQGEKEKAPKKETPYVAEPVPGTEGGLYVFNAGLVLLWPFLRGLFRKLNYIEGKNFADKEKQERAAHLLQYIVDESEEQPAEHLLPLNKLLCGLDPSEPLGRWLALTEEEKNEAALFIASVKAQWPQMKNTSLETFKRTFIRREGLLSRKDEHWQLQVKFAAVDVLLKKLPWGVSTVKLPWIEGILFVKWKI